MGADKGKGGGGSRRRGRGPGPSPVKVQKCEWARESERHKREVGSSSSSSRRSSLRWLKTCRTRKKWHERSDLLRFFIYFFSFLEGRGGRRGYKKHTSPDFWVLSLSLFSSRGICQPSLCATSTASRRAGEGGGRGTAAAHPPPCGSLLQELTPGRPLGWASRWMEVERFESSEVFLCLPPLPTSSGFFF